MADDRMILANRTLPWQEIQRDHPGSMVSLDSGSAINRITTGVKARRDRSLLLTFRSAGWASPSGKVSFERKKNTTSLLAARPSLFDFGRYKGPWRHLLPNAFPMGP